MKTEQCLKLVSIVSRRWWKFHSYASLVNVAVNIDADMLGLIATLIQRREDALSSEGWFKDDKLRIFK